jgi:hypothetical protein
MRDQKRTRDRDTPAELVGGTHLMSVALIDEGLA